jgi:uncharacterized protein (TIGR02117 family)
MRIQYWIAWVAMTVVSVAGAYLMAVLTASHIPRNANWQPAKSGITVYVATNGHHTGLVLPASEAGVDWLQRARPEHLADPQLTGRWLLFGWGDRDFYLSTPTWDEFTPRTALIAIVGSGGSLMHIDHMDAPGDAVTIRPVRLRPEEYRRLVAFIDRSFVAGGLPIPGYGPRDLFYPARGRYSLFYTCNSWTADALAAAGVRVALWTPFESGVMRWFAPAPPTPPRQSHQSPIPAPF